VSYKRGVREIQSFMHRKLGGDDPTFDNGDEVSISVCRKKPAIQIRTIGVQWLHDQEEGKDDDDDAAHVAKVEIASRIFRNYYCGFYCKSNDGNIDRWYKI
jgi:hypothetical protein